MSSFILKIIAIITMFIDHLSFAYNGSFSYLNFLGRLSFPIFAFQISEGYLHTKNIKKYLFRLLLFAVISQIPFSLFLHLVAGADIYSLNIFFTLILGLISIIIYDEFIFKNKDKDKHIFKFLAVFMLIIISIIAQVLKCDYGAFGVIVILLFHIFKNKKILMSLSFVIACIVKNLINILLYKNIIIYSFITLFTISSIIPILIYNGKQGYRIKYLIYAFYPIHLLTLYCIFR